MTPAADDRTAPAAQALPWVIVLAAGRGERFRAAGGSTHKLDALLAGRAVLQHTLDAVRASGLRWHVVQPDASRPGMGDSIAAGVAATASAPGWLILPADLPLVLPGTLRAVALALLRASGDAGAPADAASGGFAVVVPEYEGQRAHPVGFSAGCGAALRSLSGDRGAAAVLRSNRVQVLPVDDPGCVLDVDTPQALAQAQALWLARHAPGQDPGYPIAPR